MQMQVLRGMTGAPSPSSMNDPSNPVGYCQRVLHDVCKQPTKATHCGAAVCKWLQHCRCLVYRLAAGMAG